MFLMDNGLVNLMNVLLVDDRLMDLSDNGLMMLVYDVLVVFMENVLVMLMDNILVNLFHNRSFDNLLDNGCFLMSLKDCSSFMSLNLLSLMMGNDNRLLLNHLNSCL